MSNWTTHRHNISGVITRRSISGLAGAVWNDGHCTIQQFGFNQEHNGSSFSGPITFAGVGPQWQVPCAFLDHMAGQRGVAGPGAGGTVVGAQTGGSNSGGGGGLCSNTCRTSSDGECDDGGPNSLYSICALGTDCNDCGVR